MQSLKQFQVSLWKTQQLIYDLLIFEDHFQDPNLRNLLTFQRFSRPSPS